MSRNLAWLGWLALTASCHVAQTFAQDPDGADRPRNLLTIEQAQILETSAPKEESPKLAALIDGDSVTPVVLSATTDAPLEVVFQFSEQTVSPERLVVELGDSESSSPFTVEVLGSTLSAHTGFQSLRVARPETLTGRHEFPFVQSGAKWIQVRIASVTDSDSVAIAEIEVLGHIGPPVTRYAFKESPAGALDVISELAELVNVQLTPDERSLFADARDGQLDDWTFAEAALIASGVTDRSERAPYLRKVEELQAEARTAIGSATPGFTQGEKLLHYLHSKALSQGYVSQQTTVSALLDTAKFNCVSSATIYNIIGRRLGLDVRAIEVPDHAFSIVYEGSRHADVETTTAQGFNPSRDPRILERFREQTGFQYVPDRHPEQRREIRETGLVSIIYYNRGVMHNDEKEFDQALVRYFCALSLDPEFDSAIKNALATLANWGVALSNDDRFEEALAVVNTGLKLAPEDATLLNNRKAIWHSRIDSAIDAGHSDSALALLRQAHEQVPDGNFQSMQSWVFLKPAEEAIDQERWEQALELAKAGLPKVDAEGRQELEDWQKGLFLRWSNQKLGADQFAEAVAVLEKGLAMYPDDSRMTNNLGYLTQEWAEHAAEAEGAPAAEAVLNRMLAAHGPHQSVQDVAESWVVRRVNQLRSEQQWDQALEAVTRGEPFVRSEQVRLTLTRSVYDSWSEQLSKQGQWEDALAIYEKALEQLPDDPHLTNNRKATWDAWAQTHISAHRWDQAAEVYAQAMKRLPEAGFESNLGFITQEWLDDALADSGLEGAVKVAEEQLKQFNAVSQVRTAAQNHFSRTAATLAGQQKFEEALQVIDQAETLFDDQTALLSAARAVYDRWAATYEAQKQWQQAADIYAQALKHFPGDSHLENNAAVVWNSWAGTYIDNKQWAEAIKVYEQALKALPSSSLLKNNLQYCRQQAGQ